MRYIWRSFVKTQELKESIQQLNNEIKEQEDKIKSCAEERERLRYISDYFRMRAEKYEVLGTLPQSQRTFVISGYTAKKFVPALEKAIGANYDCVMDVEEVGEEEEVPTILQNNSFSRSWEGIDNDHVIFLCIFLWHDAVRCGIRSNFGNCLLCPAEEISAYESRNVPVYQTVYVLWNFHCHLGNPVWRILWKYCGCGIGKIFRNNDHTGGIMVYSFE